jgi:hypothetical protein
MFSRTLMNEVFAQAVEARLSASGNDWFLLIWGGDKNCRTMVSGYAAHCDGGP